MDENAAAAAAGGIMLVVLLIELAVVGLVLAGLWKVFAKAGKPGWAAIVPIYNAWVLVEISGKGALWFVLMLVPFVNLIAAILVMIAVAEKFGKGAGFGLGMAFLGPIFIPMLGFGSAQYRGVGPSSAMATA